MSEWYSLVQTIVEEVDECIQKRNDETLTLSSLSQKLGYSEFYISRKFREISGMHFRDYLRQRTLAFALKEVRDSSKGLLEIALDYSFSSHEAFSRSFKEAYGITPSEYLHIRNYESNGYWDFWQKQSQIPGQDYDTICGLLDSIKGKHLVIALTLHKAGYSIFIMIRNDFGSLSDR